MIFHLKTAMENRNDVVIKGTVWIEKVDGSGRFLGKGRIQLLELIIEQGSISKAAKEMKMSYKRAWDLINSMNSQSAKPFVITQTGGKSGGGALVTTEGHQAIADFKALQERFQKFLSQENLK
jgi:molybdate transport system regulatory protein